MAGRKSSGEGSIYKRQSDGLWIGAVVTGYDERGKLKRKTVSAKKRDEVVAKLRKVQSHIDDGLPPPNDQLTLNQLLDQWLKDILRHSVSRTTYENYESIAKNHIRPTLGRVRVSKLTAVQVDQLVSAKLDQKRSGKDEATLSVTTVRRIRNVLSQALDQGVRWSYISRNVVLLTKGPKAPRRKGRAMKPEQARDLLAAAQDDRLEALYVTVLALGLRSGEALALSWNDINLTSGLLTVNQGLKRERNKLIIGEVKTPTSVRSINLPPAVVDVLRRHKARQAEERLAAGSAWENRGLVFTTAVGTPIDPSNLRREFNALTKKAGIGHWTPHELRHTAATLMLEGQVPIEVVAEVLGHSSIRMTADVYAHVRAPQRQIAADAMEKILWA